MTGHTDDHAGELESLSDRLSMHLIGQIGESDKAKRMIARLLDSGTTTEEETHACNFLRTALESPAEPLATLFWISAGVDA
jgi:hypothetical protein